MEIEVSGCTDCLLREVFESGSSFCNHPRKGTYLYEDSDGNVITPSDCPLFAEPIIISIKLP